MSKLVDALRKFNRKERYWLLHNAIGKKFETLDEGFRKRFEEKTGIPIPDNHWWAMDYHFDWLTGALHLAGGGKMDESQPIVDGQVTGTQEDIDLVIAFGDTLILIEAKGDTPWSNKQLNEKVNKRLVSIFGENCERYQSLKMHFVLMSPEESGKLERTKAPTSTWPSWMLNQKTQRPQFVPMEMGKGLVRVTRCDKDLKQSATGDFWKVTKSKFDR